MRKQSLSPAIMSAGEIRALSFQFLPVTTGTHTKTHWSRSMAWKSSQNTRDGEDPQSEESATARPEIWAGH